MRLPAIWILALVSCNFAVASAQDAPARAVSTIAPVWAGHPVDFALVVDGQDQFVAYYDTARQLVVTHRSGTSSPWTFTRLPTTTGWDSHNGIAMALDDSGFVHVSANMHNVPLIYFRSSKPRDISAFAKSSMTGSLESSVTYPVFFHSQTGRLYFQFRDGGSGNGNTLWNVYSSSSRKWTRVGTGPLFDGQGLVNAYPSNPVLGPDGMFHILWMWRETPVANTNKLLSHIRSPDLEAWQTQSGQKLTLPITTGTAGVVVDPVAAGHGLINMDFAIGWDAQQRPVATYHRYNADSISQIFDTRWENGKWTIHQASAWRGYKWPLDLNGSLTHEIAAQPVVTENAQLVQRYVYRDGIRRKWILDPTTLAATRDSFDVRTPERRVLDSIESSYPGMEGHLIDQGEWVLRWETLPTNQDLGRTEYPSSSTLRLYHFAEPSTRQQASRKTTRPSIRASAGRLLIRNPSPILSTWSVDILTPQGRRLALRRLQNTDRADIALPTHSPGLVLVRITTPTGISTTPITLP